MSKFIKINSQDLTTGSENNYTLTFSNAIKDIKRVKGFSIVFPHQIYTVDTHNNKFSIFAGAVEYIATLNTGVYSTGASMATELQTQLNTAYIPDNLFTVTYSALTGKFTITHGATNFQVYFGSTTQTALANKLYGFNLVDTTAGLSVTSPNIINLVHSNTIGIRSRKLAHGSSYFGPDKRDIILEFPLTGVFGDVIVWQANGDEWFINYDKKNGKTFDYVDIALVFEDGSTLVPTNGLDWSLTLGYENI
jgi:hypothetical protein